jgi:hypothetical protein
MTRPSAGRRGPADRPAPVAEHALDGRREALRVLGIAEEPVLPVLDEVDKTAHARRDDRPGRAPGLEHHDAERLVERRQRNDVGGGESVRELGAVRGEGAQDPEGVRLPAFLASASSASR